MNGVITKWKKERGFTFQFISDLLGLSVTHVQNSYYSKNGLSDKVLKTVMDIDRILNLIDTEPSDAILLKYELSQLTGLPMEEIEKGKTKGKGKLSREAILEAQSEPKNLRVVTLRALENMRENGYKSVYRPNVSYDANEVDAEIARKKFNLKRKAENWEKKQSLNA